MTAYEEMNAIAKQISDIHKEISNYYRIMSIRNSEYYWKSIEQRIEQEKAKAAVLREKLIEVSRRFVNWQENK